MVLRDRPTGSGKTHQSVREKCRRTPSKPPERGLKIGKVARPVGIDGQARRALNEVRRELESIHKILEDWPAQSGEVSDGRVGDLTGRLVRGPTAIKRAIEL